MKKPNAKSMTHQRNIQLISQQKYAFTLLVIKVYFYFYAN